MGGRQRDGIISRRSFAALFVQPVFRAVYVRRKIAREKSAFADRFRKKMRLVSAVRPRLFGVRLFSFRVDSAAYLLEAISKIA